MRESEPTRDTRTSRPTPRLQLTAAHSRFAYLDGIRGFACIAVVLLHAFLFTGRTGQSEEELPLVGLLVGWGWLGVPVFIVLSGYLLMGGVDEDLRFRRGTVNYLSRRARRILPPYYAALLISLLLIASLPILQSRSDTQWDTKIPVTLWDVVSHALLIHNARAEWIGTINGPLWSVAIEWQIYFLLPLLLLPMWRVLNRNVAVALIVVLTMIPGFVGDFAYMHPWYLGLFALGMRARELTDRARPVRWAGAVAICAFAAIPIAFATSKALGVEPPVFKEMACGLFICAVLVWAGRQPRTPRPLMPFESTSFKFAGQISYSVYLLHSPLLGLGNLLLIPLDLNIMLHWILMTFVIAPIVVGFCYLFYLVVENHFLNTHQRQIARTVGQSSCPRTI